MIFSRLIFALRLSWADYKSNRRYNHTPSNIPLFQKIKSFFNCAVEIFSVLFCVMVNLFVFWETPEIIHAFWQMAHHQDIDLTWIFWLPSFFWLVALGGSIREILIFRHRKISKPTLKWGQSFVYTIENPPPIIEKWAKGGGVMKFLFNLLIMPPFVFFFCTYCSTRLLLSLRETARKIKETIFELTHKIEKNHLTEFAGYDSKRLKKVLPVSSSSKPRNRL